MARLRPWFLGLVAAAVATAAAPAAAPTASAAPQRVHALVVADTLDPNIGDSTAVDRDNIKYLLTSGIPASRLSLTVLDGSNVTRAQVLGAIQRLNVQPYDTVFVWFSGHGGTDPTYGHALAMTGVKSFLYRSELLAAVSRKRPRLTVVMTDCCANMVRLQAMAESMKLDLRPVMQRLLLKHSGLVDWNGCTRGEQAAGTSALGGLFTHSFEQVVLDLAYRRTTASWGQLFPMVVRETQKSAREQTVAQTPQTMTSLYRVRADR
jgi:hypothetical protein